MRIKDFSLCTANIVIGINESIMIVIERDSTGTTTIKSIFTCTFSFFFFLFQFNALE
jgi:hypothetical protein